MKDNKVVEGVAVEVVEETEVVEAKKGLLARANDVRKKHGKTLLIAVGTGLLGIMIGKAVSKKSGDSDVYDYDNSEDNDDYNSDVEVTEF